MGYLQEARAEAAVAALRAMSAAGATVVRGGRRQSVPAADVVAGDVMLVEEGDTIPADGRLVESAALQTAEAALTGESVPVAKDTASIDGDAALGDRHNMVFSGTAATYGHGRAVVTATGMRTEMGRIAGLLKQTPDEPTPLQRELDRTGKRLGLVVLAIAIVMIATILLVQDVRGAAAIFDVLILGVALAVAAVPEGLPAVVTVVLSIGVQRMARRHAIIRHLAAVETLGSATRHRLGQDRHAHEERDDGARGGHGQRARRLRWHRLRAGRLGAPRRRRRHRRPAAASSSIARSPSPTAPTTRSCTSVTDAGPSTATRPKARCWSPRARPASNPRRSTSGCRASARCRSRPSAS